MTNDRTNVGAMALFALLALAACGGESTSPDAGGDRTDAGTPGLDAGAARDGGDLGADGGPAPDGGEAGDDGGPADGGAVTCPTGLRGGDHVMLTLESGGLTREYTVHVPTSYAGTDPVPLVLDFHGYTSDAGQQALLSGMDDKADEEGFVSVHANGYMRSWNAGDCCGGSMSGGIDDVAFVRALIDDVASRVCIDRRRVYATGMSNGGFLSHRLACQASDVIAAIAPVAGVIGVPDEECAPGRAVPVMHFHGTSDRIVPYEGGGISGFRSVADTVDSWATRNGCTDTAEVTHMMGDTTCETRDACDAGAEVTLCTIEGFGHWWPGNGSDVGIDATDAMWTFFSRFSL